MPQPPNFEMTCSSEIQSSDGAPASISITVQGFLTFKQPVGKRRVSLPDGSSLANALDLLRQDIGSPFEVQAYDPSGELSEHIAVLLNGAHCRHLPDGLNTILKEGDQVAIFPPLAGGSISIA